MLTTLPDLIECGPYVTGANFSGVKPYLAGLVDLGFPIAEIAYDGTTIITKHPGSAGYVDEMNVRAQFLYEIQGTKYINSDVLSSIRSRPSAACWPLRIDEEARNEVGPNPRR